MRDSSKENEPLSAARGKIAHVRLNGLKKWGSYSVVHNLVSLAPPVMSGPDYESSLEATANAVMEDIRSIDPTHGALRFNIRVPIPSQLGGDVFMGRHPTRIPAHICHRPTQNMIGFGFGRTGIKAQEEDYMNLLRLGSGKRYSVLPAVFILASILGASHVRATKVESALSCILTMPRARSALEKHWSRNTLQLTKPGRSGSDVGWAPWGLESRPTGPALPLTNSQAGYTGPG